MESPFEVESGKQAGRHYIMGEELDKYTRYPETYDEENQRMIATVRSRPLKEYSRTFTGKACGRSHYEGWLSGLDSNGIYHLFNHFLSKNGRVVWVDLGCGNAVALRQAKKHFKDAGLGVDNLVAIGYDMLPVDMFEYEYRRKKSPGDYADSDFDPEFEPTVLLESAADARFPETPDIVTCLQVLQWTEYPLEMFANAASQIPQGGVMNIHGLSHATGYSSSDQDIEHPLPLFHKLSGLAVEGFEIPMKDMHSGTMKEPSVMVRTEEHVDDFMFGLQRVGSRHEWDNWNERYRRDLRTYYTRNHST